MSNPRRLADYIEEVTGAQCFFQLNSGRAGYEQLISFLRGMDSSQLQQLYQKAKAEADEISQARFKRHSSHLWFFSHPTYEVFLAFLSNDSLVHHFISFILMIPKARKNKNTIKRSTMTGSLKSADTFTLFLKPYLQMMRDSLGGNGSLDIGIVNNRTQKTALPMVALPTAEDMTVRALHVEYFSTVIQEQRRVLERVTRQLGSLLASEAFTKDEVELTLPQMYEMFGVPVVKLKADATSDIDNKAWQRFSSALKCGSWMRFPMLELKPHWLEVKATAEERGRIGKVALNFVSQKSAGRVKRWTETTAGCLPVGLKIHALKGRMVNIADYRGSSFKLEAAGAKVVLAPVANATAAVDLLELVEEKVGEPIIDNEDYQIQVCSQSRLTADRAACLGIAFYLGSDRIRTYNERSLVTSHASQTGKRLVIYGAGVCEKDFDWCEKGDNGEMVVGKTPSKIRCRTDVLWCHSRRDIYNVNLIATLLVHDQFDGFWQPLGDVFKHGIRDILEQHQLKGIFDAPWIQVSTGTFDADDKRFAEAFTELSMYARAEADRLQSGSVPHTGILKEVDDLLRYCHESVRGEVPW